MAARLAVDSARWQRRREEGGFSSRIATRDAAWRFFSGDSIPRRQGGGASRAAVLPRNQRAAAEAGTGAAAGTDVPLAPLALLAPPSAPAPVSPSQPPPSARNRRT